MWQNFWKLWKLIERFSHTHDHKFMLLVFISWCLTDISLFFLFCRGWRTNGGGWRALLILVQETLNDSNTFFSPIPHNFNIIFILCEKEETARRRWNCVRGWWRNFSLYFLCKSFFSSYFHPKNQLGFECKKRAENVCYTWFQRKFFNNNISLYLFASCIMGKFSTWLLLHVYVWQTSVKERESIEMKLSRENLIWFPFFLSFYL